MVRATSGRGVRAVAWAVALSTLATACAAETAAEDDVATVRVMLADDWASAPAVAEAIARFEARTPHVRVALQGVPFAQIPDALRAAEETGRPVDVVQWHAFALAESGLAEEVSDLWEAHGLSADEWLAGALEDVTWEGGRYGVPLDTNAMVLMVNEEMLEAAGVSPGTLRDADGFAAAAAQLTGASSHALAVPSSGWVAYGWVRAFGGELVVLRDDEVDITFDDPAVARALDYVAGLTTAGHAVPPRARDVSQDAMSLFRAGIAAMHTSGSWDVAASLAEADPAVDLAVLPMPTGGPDAGTALGGSSLAVVSGSRERDLSFQLMLALVEDEAALAYARDDGRLPARRALLAAPIFEDPVYRTVVDELPRASADRIIAFPRSSRAFKEAFEDVVLGRATATEALARAQRIADEELGERS